MSRVDFVAEKEEEEEKKIKKRGRRKKRRRGRRRSMRKVERSGSKDEKKGDLGSSNYDAVVRTPST